jgi:Flp pilus assembly protein TadG
MKNQSTWRDELGAEQVEFAFVVVLLFTLILGLFWFARAYNVHQTMTRAAREGARMAVLPSSFAAGNSFLDAPNVTKSESVVFASHIVPVLLSANLDPAQVTGYSQQVRWLNPGDSDQQCGVVIAFSYPFTFHIPFSSLNLATIHLNTQVQMRRENQPSAGSCP